MTLKKITKKITPQPIVQLYRNHCDKKILKREKAREIEENKARVALYKTLITPGDICFDVGANVGNRVAPLLEVGAKVVAIEPQEECRAVLEEKFGNTIIVVPYGIDATPGTKTLHISDATVISSFSEDWIDSVKEERFKTHNWNKSVEIEMTTLDNLIEEHGLPTFIKIDVEGFELQVLKGLSKPIKYISFEYIVPEQLDSALNCLKQIESINPSVVFNYCIGESMKWAMPQWLNAAEMVEHMDSQEFVASNFGDIYAHSK